MSKLKTFEEYTSEKLKKEANTISEATVVMDAVDPNSKGLAKLLKKNKVSMEILDMEGPSGYPEVELRGSRKDLVAVLSDPNHGWDDADLAEYIEESKEAKESKLVSEMLQDVYESCKNEAKAYEEDAHDDHTIESYMVENAALIATLAAKSLNEMKEEYSKEAYEAACNSMVESYTKKMDEMKESNSPEDAGDLAESKLQEENELDNIIEEGTRSQVGKITKGGKILSVYMHYDGYPDNMLPIIKKGYKDVKGVNLLLKNGGGSGLEADPNKINFYGDRQVMKGDAKNIKTYIKNAGDDGGAEYVYLYDERDGKWYMVDVYGETGLVPAFEGLINQ
jgi:hypothetical protein